MLKKTLAISALFINFAVAGSVISGKNDTTSTAITLYQSGAANIVEVRTAKGLKNGVNTVHLEGLLNQYDENLSVEAKGLISLSLPVSDFTMDSLRRFEGRQVSFLSKEKGMLTKPREGKLLKVLPDDKFVMEFKTGIEVGIEGNLILKPEDFARMVPSFSLSSAGGSESFTLNYNANGLSWRPIYRLNIDENGEGYLTAEALVQNSAEQDVKNAVLTLASGGGMVGFEASFQPQGRMLAFSSPAMDGQTPEVSPSANLLNKWSFQIPGVVDLEAGKIGKFSMISNANIAATKVITFESYVGKYPVPNREAPFKPLNHIKFVNNTGLSLPSGAVKVYEAKTKKFAAEDRLPDTAAGQEVKIRLGEVADVNVSRMQKSFAVNEAKEYVMEIEIALSNLSPSLKIITVTENFDSQFDIKKSNKKYKIKGQAAEWQLSVTPGSSEVLSYQVVLR